MEEKITRSIELTVEQWQRLSEIIDCYWYTINGIYNYHDAQKFRSDYIQPILDQMPDESF